MVDLMVLAYRVLGNLGLFSLVIHPNFAQLVGCLMLGGTFVAFIPTQASRLPRARGEAYAAYMGTTPWRLFRGVW